jgi:putative intracellular protease/amidase
MVKILMVLTSYDQLGNTGGKTGFWLEQFASPYFVFRDAGVDLTLASPKGGQPPIDPKSDFPQNQTAAMARFEQDKTAQQALAHTDKLADVKAEEFDTVFYVGGDAPMWDVAESRDATNLLESFYSSGKPIALVYHSLDVPGDEKLANWQPYSIADGRLITGQNPASSASAAEALVKLLGERAGHASA